MIPNIMRGYASKNRKNYGEALEKFNAVQQSLLSGAENVKVCLYRSNAKRIIENKNNEIEKEEKRLRNCQVSVYGLAGGMQLSLIHIFKEASSVLFPDDSVLL